MTFELQQVDSSNDQHFDEIDGRIDTLKNSRWISGCTGTFIQILAIGARVALPLLSIAVGLFFDSHPEILIGLGSLAFVTICSSAICEIFVYSTTSKIKHLEREHSKLVAKQSAQQINNSGRQLTSLSAISKKIQYFSTLPSKKYVVDASHLIRKSILNCTDLYAYSNYKERHIEFVGNAIAEASNSKDKANLQEEELFIQTIDDKILEYFEQSTKDIVELLGSFHASSLREPSSTSISFAAWLSRRINPKQLSKENQSVLDIITDNCPFCAEGVKSSGLEVAYLDDPRFYLKVNKTSGNNDSSSDMMENGMLWPIFITPDNCMKSSKLPYTVRTAEKSDHPKFPFGAASFDFRKRSEYLSASRFDPDTKDAINKYWANIYSDRFPTALLSIPLLWKTEAEKETLHAPNAILNIEVYMGDGQHLFENSPSQDVFFSSITALTSSLDIVLSAFFLQETTEPDLSNVGAFYNVERAG